MEQTEAQQKSEEDIIRDLERDINRFQTILNNLENNQGWILLKEMFEEQLAQIDGMWQNFNVYDQQQLAHLQESRITKMAYITLINTLANVKADLQKAQQDLNGLKHPELYQTGYVDKD